MGSLTNPRTCSLCQTALEGTYHNGPMGAGWWTWRCPVCDATPTPPIPVTPRHDVCSRCGYLVVPPVCTKCYAPFPTPPAPADDKCWKCGGGVERTNTTPPGCDNDIFHDGQPPALPTEGAHPNGPVEGCPCHLCRYAFGEDSPADDARPMVTGGGLIKFDRRADDAGGAEAMREAWAYAIVNAQGKRTGVIHADRSRLVPIVEADNDDDLAGGPFRIVPLAPPAPADDASGAEPVAWAMCLVPFGHDSTAARPKLLFDTKDRAEDVARRQSSFGVGTGAQFIVRPMTWADAIPLSARREDAVVEAARALVKSAIDARADEAVTGIIVPEAEWDALLAALRGANGGNAPTPDDRRGEDGEAIDAQGGGL